MKPTRQAIINVAVVAILSTVSGVVVAGVMTGEEDVRPSPPAKTPVELVAVPVATKDIPVWTKFTKDNVKEYFVFRQYSRKSVPSNAVLDLEELNDKWTTRPIDQGEVVRTNHVYSRSSIDPPEGTEAITIHVAANPAEVGFILPGFGVMVAVTKKSESKGKEMILPMAPYALILAIDCGDTPEDRVRVTIALTPEQRDVLAPALEAGAILRLQFPRHDEGLGYETENEVVLKATRSAEDVRAFLADR